MLVKKNGETNPITLAGILVIPEIEGQREPSQFVGRLGPAVRPSPRRCPSAVPSLLRRRRHGFPRSHGPPESKVNGQWLTLRCPFFLLDGLGRAGATPLPALVAERHGGIPGDQRGANPPIDEPFAKSLRLTNLRRPISGRGHAGAAEELSRTRDRP
jgi:hypothetical protein